MRRFTVALAALSLLGGPAVAVARDQKDPGQHHARNVARQQCQAERTELGVMAFRAKYGTPNAFKNCVKAHRPADKTAAGKCRAERKTLGGKAFRQKYGQRNALNQCIKVTTAG